MNEANKNLQQFKPKWCGHAIASFLIPCISIIGSFSFLFAIQLIQYNHLYINIGIAILILLFALPFLPFLSFIMGIWSFFVIIKSRSFLKGYIFAFLGIIISVPAFVVTFYAYNCKQNEVHLRLCQGNIIQLHEAIANYGKNHNNQYPSVDKWCDLLANESEPNVFRFFLTTRMENFPYYCSYAINPKAEPNSAPDVVLLFETKDGWNQFGGSELMVFDNHYRKGCNVLFNDGHTEFIKPKQKDKLRWRN